MKPKHKEGATVVITANKSMHGFEIGQKVVIEKIMEWGSDNYSYMANTGLESNHTWFFNEDECKRVPK